MNQLVENYREEIQEILKRYPPEQKRAALMPLLFLAQRENNFVSDQSIREISEILQVSPTDVASIAGFYSLFHQEPGGHYRIQVCTDLPCALRGADRFLKDLSEYLSIEVGGTTPDGFFTLEEVKCLAACDHAPMFQLQGKGTISYHQDQTLDTAKTVIEGIRQSASLKMEGEL